MPVLSKYYSSLDNIECNFHHIGETCLTLLGTASCAVYQ